MTGDGVAPLAQVHYPSPEFRGVYHREGLGEQSPTFFNMGGEGMVISIAFSTNFLRLDRQCQTWGVDLPPIVGVRRPWIRAKYRLLYRKSRSLSKNMTSDIARELAK